MANNPPSDADNPEWTTADFSRARPASEVLPPQIARSLVRKIHSSAFSGALDRQQPWARGWSLAA